MKKKLLLFVAIVSVMLFALAFTSLAVEVDGIYYTLNGSGDDAYAIVNTENRSKCTLETVVIPATITVNGITYKVTDISSSAFGSTSGSSANNQYVKTVKVGAYVKSIGHHAFRNLANFESIEIDNYLAESAISCSNAEFYCSTNLKTVVCTERSKIAQFGSVCFNGCSSLTSVTFPPSLTSLGGSAFKSCNLTQLDLSKTKVTSIPSWCFGGNANLSVIKFPNTLESIGGNSLQNCIATTIVFPHSLKTISSDAFGHCYQAGATMFIPALEEDGFGYASGFLHSLVPNVVIYAGNNPEFLKSSINNFSQYDIQPFSNYVAGTTYAKNTIFYGADTCDTCNGLIGEREFVFTSLAEVMKDQVLCTNCGGGDVTTYPAVFTNLGFSKFAPTNSVIQGFAICQDSLDLYNEKFPEAQINGYGLLAVVKSNAQNGTAFDEQGNANKGVACVDMSERDYDLIEMRVTGLASDSFVPNTEIALADVELYLNAYIVVGDTIYYMSRGQVSTTLVDAFTYNSIE